MHRGSLMNLRGKYMTFLQIFLDSVSNVSSQEGAFFGSLTRDPSLIWSYCTFKLIESYFRWKRFA